MSFTVHLPRAFVECALTGERGRLRVTATADENTGALSQFAFSLPDGWVIRDGEPVCPQAQLPDPDTISDPGEKAYYQQRIAERDARAANRRR
jgi:hypothetical protein